MIDNWKLPHPGNRRFGADLPFREALVHSANPQSSLLPVASVLWEQLRKLKTVYVTACFAVALLFVHADLLVGMARPSAASAAARRRHKTAASAAAASSTAPSAPVRSARPAASPGLFSGVMMPSGRVNGPVSGPRPDCAYASLLFRSS